MTLDSFEKENVKMKKVSFKKSIIIAAAVLASAQWHLRQKVQSIMLWEVHRQAGLYKHSRYGNA